MTSFENFALFDFIAAIPNDEAAIRFCMDNGLIPHEVKCPCGTVMGRSRDLGRKIGFRWRCPSCGVRVSPLENTWFEYTHNSFVTALRLTACLVHRIPVCDAAQFCGVSSHPAVDWYKFCREVCEIVVANNQHPIGGPNLFVEIDETHLGERQYHRGRHLASESIWLFGGICRETKMGFVVRVIRRDRATLWPLIQKYVSAESVIVTDSARVYSGCEGLGYSAHHSVCHKRHFVCPSNREVHTNTIERQWRSVKETVKYFGDDEALDRYLGEYSYRDRFLKPLGSYGHQFRQFLGDVVRVYPGPYKPGIDFPME
jgi:transposase-like protein